jgi:RNA polymerase sigma factor (sigma-70 family)
VDSQEFDELYREHAGQVLAYCLRRSPDSADDAVAETFATAWRRRDAIPAEPLPWLYGVARRVLANQRRSSRRQLSLTRRLAEVPPAAVAPTSLAPVLAALARLRPADRELLTLVAWEGLTPTQAATVLGSSATACRVRLFRARRRLERLLEAENAVAMRAPTEEVQP